MIFPSSFFKWIESFLLCKFILKNEWFYNILGAIFYSRISRMYQSMDIDNKTFDTNTKQNMRQLLNSSYNRDLSLSHMGLCTNDKSYIFYPILWFKSWYVHQLLEGITKCMYILDNRPQGIFLFLSICFTHDKLQILDNNPNKWFRSLHFTPLWYTHI